MHAVEKQLRTVALKSILFDPEAQMRANVNHDNNFATHYSGKAAHAMLKLISDRVDHPNQSVRSKWTSWFNTASRPEHYPPDYLGRIYPKACSSQFDKLSLEIAREAYFELKRSPETNKWKRESKQQKPSATTQSNSDRES